MRVMLMIKGDPERGAAPSEELLAAWAGTTTSSRRPECSSTSRGFTRAPGEAG